MNTQPEALRLADRLNAWPDAEELDDAAAELRRLHALNAELLEALTSIAKNGCCDRCQEAALVARAAIAKAEDQQ